MALNAFLYVTTAKSVHSVSGKMLYFVDTGMGSISYVTCKELSLIIREDGGRRSTRSEVAHLKS